MRRIIPLVAALAIPLTFTITWLFHNNILPGADGSNFLETGIAIYQNFIDKGILHGVHSLYALRGWRPVAFPIITVPFLLITQGNLLISYSCAVALIILLSALYIFLFLRLQLDRASAAVSTALICLLPSIQMVPIYFFADSLFLPFAIGGIYHLIKSRYLTNKKHTILFSVCVIAATLMRPVEAATSFMLPFSWYLFWAFKQNKLSLDKFLNTAKIILLFIAIWYVPFYKETYEWVYQTSFGSVAAADGRSVGSILSSLEFQIIYQGLIPTIAILMLAFLNAALNRLRNIWRYEFTYILLLAPISVAEVLLTIQNLPRKIAVAYTALLMVALMIALKKGYAWRLRIGMGGVVLGLQFTIAMLAVTNHNSLNNILKYYMTGMAQPIKVTPNPYDQFAKFMAEASARYHFKNVVLALGTREPEPIDPFLFITVNTANRQKVSLYYPFFSTFDKSALEKINEFDALLVADKVEYLTTTQKAAKRYKKQLEDKTFIGEKTRDYFRYHYAANDLKKLGWKVGACTLTNSLNNETYKACILLRVKHV